MSSIDRQVILTLSYSQQFSYPLSIKELWYRLLRTRNNSNISIRELHSSLIRLKRSGSVVFEDGHILLTPAKNLAKRKQARLISSLKKRAELVPLLKLCELLPWVAGLAITGSLAMNNADQHADADVMIVTENNRLWLVRPILVLFSFLYGKRRSWNKEEENSWCLNLWLERDSVGIAPEQRSVYTAYEVLQADWVLSKDGLMNEFYLANRWIDGYFNRVRVPTLKESWSGLKIPILSQCFDLLNFLALKIQIWYMTPHMTKEKVSNSVAFFHPRDTKSWIVSSWRKVIKTATISQYDHNSSRA